MERICGVSGKWHDQFHAEAVQEQSEQLCRDTEALSELSRNDPSF